MALTDDQKLAVAREASPLLFPPGVEATVDLDALTAAAGAMDGLIEELMGTVEAALPEGFTDATTQDQRITLFLRVLRARRGG